MAHQAYNQIQTLAPVAIGCIVTCDVDDIPMTVERVDGSGPNAMVTCCWFGEDFILNVQTLVLQHLKSSEVRSRTTPISINQQVELRSSGPAMNVLSVDRYASKSVALCEWTGSEGIVRRRHFPIAALKAAPRD
jgi:uncharacterized protein YodC (DUF2158 family)